MSPLLTQNDLPWTVDNAYPELTGQASRERHGLLGRTLVFMVSTFKTTQQQDRSEPQIGTNFIDRESQYTGRTNIAQAEREGQRDLRHGCEWQRLNFGC